MPATPMFSRKLYDKLGDDVAGELVDWLSAVDSGYRTEFRELFDANFGRLEARLAQLASELRGEMNVMRAELRAEMQSEVARLRADLYDRIAAGEKRLVAWMFAFWIGSWAAMAGTIIALQKLGWIAAP